MTVKERIKRYSRELLEISMEGGRLDPERISAVLDSLERREPRGYLAILRAYRKRVAEEVARGQAVIEYAGGLDDAQADALAESFSRRYNRDITPVKKPNPDLIAGLRVRVHCDVYEDSLSSRLRALEEGAD